MGLPSAPRAETVSAVPTRDRTNTFSSDAVPRSIVTQNGPTDPVGHPEATVIGMEVVAAVIDDANVAVTAFPECSYLVAISYTPMSSTRIQLGSVAEANVAAMPAFASALRLYVCEPAEGVSTTEGW
jgi:hypothetical protein